MRWMVLGVSALCLSVAAGCGCRPDGPPRKETFRVTGKVTVDGQAPPTPVQIEAHNVAGMDAQMPTLSQCETNPDGTFEITTYVTGDGVPAGDYQLTFTCSEFNAMSRSYGPDKLNKRYSNPKTSEIKFTIKDQSVDLGEIKLTTK